MAEKGKLTARQQRFVQEYLLDLNATQAACRAGFSKNGARQQGMRLLTNASICAQIARGKAKTFEGLDISRERILRELARIAFGDPRKVMEWGPSGVNLIDSETLTDDEAAQVSEVSQSVTKDGGTIRMKRFDKVKALELLGRHTGMFADKPEGEPVDETDDVCIYIPENGR